MKEVSLVFRNRCKPPSTILEEDASDMVPAQNRGRCYICWGPIKCQYHPYSARKPWWYIITNCSDPTWVVITLKGSAHLGYLSLLRIYRFSRKKRPFSYETVHSNWYCIQKRPQNHFKRSKWDEQCAVQCLIMSASLRLLQVAAILPWFCSKIAANHQNFWKSWQKFLEIDDQCYCDIFSWDMYCSKLHLFQLF